MSGSHTRTGAPPARLSILAWPKSGLIGLVTLGAIMLACLGTLPWTLSPAPHGDGSPRYDAQARTARHIPPTWIMPEEAGPDTARDRLRETAQAAALQRMARESGRPVEDLIHEHVHPTAEEVARETPTYLMGTDLLGRDLFVRVLAGGGISLTIGLAAAALSVVLGTLYGSIAGYLGGRADALLMRIVDILYGLPSILLVVLLAVAVESGIENWQSRRAAAAGERRDAFVRVRLEALPAESRDDPAVRARLRDEAMAAVGSGEISAGTTQAIGLVTLLVAIGGVSWLTMARVIRGQVLSLKAQPFMEAARALGVPAHAQFFRHMLPNLTGPIVVYATLTVPQAILQESFLSFLGIGVRPPLPSWGNLAADGLDELNPYRSNWWLLLFPCIMLAATLLALNFVGEGLREALDPKRVGRK